MKHAKKMVMVPEGEYIALMSMLKSSGGGGVGVGDYLQGEKAQTEAKMQTILRNPKLSEDLKAKKHDFLYKQRRKLKNIIENKPQKVVFEQQPSSQVQSSLNNSTSAVPSAYLGISSPSTTPSTSAAVAQLKEVNKEQTKQTPKKRKTPNKKTHQKVVVDKSSTDYESTKDTSDTDDTEEDHRDKTQKPGGARIIHQPYYIKKEFYDRLLNHIKSNPSKLGVTDGGQILTYKDKPIEDSDYVQHLKYISEQSSTQSRGGSFLMARLQKDALYKELNKLSHQQEGSGGDGGGFDYNKQLKKHRKVLIRINNNNNDTKLLKYKRTPGLNREENKTNQKQIFKPKIWAKL